MPAKEFSCVICGEIVSKRQSTAYKNGRACKIHDKARDVLSKKQKTESARHRKEVYQTEHADEIRAKKCRDRAKNQEKKIQKMQSWMDRRCWCCGEICLTHQEWHVRMLLGMEKQQLKGDSIDFLNPWKQRKAAGLEDITIILTFSVKSSFDWRKIKYHMRDVGQMFGSVQLCPDCGEKLGFDVKEKLKGPKIDIKAMSLMGSIYSTSGLKSDLQEIARDEIVKEGKLQILDKNIE